MGAVAWGESVVELVTAENGLGGGWGRAKGWLDYECCSIDVGHFLLFVLFCVMVQLVSQFCARFAVVASVAVPSHTYDAPIATASWFVCARSFLGWMTWPVPASSGEVQQWQARCGGGRLLLGTRIEQETA